MSSDFSEGASPKCLRWPDLPGVLTESALWAVASTVGGAKGRPGGSLAGAETGSISIGANKPRLAEMG